MTEEKSNKDSGNKTVIIAAVAVIVVIVVAGLIYNSQRQEKSVSMSIGGKEVSATIE